MDSEKIGKIIFENRRSLGLSQEELGEKIGVSNKTISKWETGICVPDKNNLKEVADLFGISLVALMNGKCEKEEKKSEDIKIKEMVDLGKLQQPSLKKDYSTDKVDIKKSQKKNMKIIIYTIILFLIILADNIILIHHFQSNKVDAYNIYSIGGDFSIDGNIIVKSNNAIINLFNVDTVSENFMKECYDYDYSIYVNDTFISKYGDISFFDKSEKGEYLELSDVLRMISLSEKFQLISKLDNDGYIYISVNYIDSNYETQTISATFIYKKI